MKKINKYILPVSVIAVALTFTGCKESFLEQEPPTKATIEDYFSTEPHIEEALASVYVPVHMYDYNTAGGYSPLNFSDILGDDFLTGAAGPTDQEQWHRAGNYNLTSETTLWGYWAESYDGIKTANETISYVENAKESLKDDTFCNRVEAEAMVMRAYYYNIVWHWFGNIPVFFNALGGTDVVEQSDHDAAYKAIIEDLEKAIALKALPMYWDDDNLGRVSQAMAYMLYAEMVMYQNDETRLKTALGYMTEIINNGHYGLNNDLTNLWSPEGEWCSESIWEINYTDGSACVRSYDNIMGIGGTWLPQVSGPEGGVSCDADVMTGGWGTYIPRRTALALYDKADKRIPVTFIDCAPGNARYQNQDLFQNKYAPRASHIAEGTGGADHCRYNDNFRVYRFAETLLNAAELELRVNNDAKKAGGYLNQVRSRAGLADETATIDNIIAERRLEFMGEGKRYWDLVRAEDISGATVKASTQLVPDADAVNDAGDAGRTGTWTKAKKYIPIKASEISAAQGTLKQNDDYLK